MKEYLPTIVVAVIALLNAALNYGAFRQKLKDHDKQFRAVDKDQDEQWDSIETNGRDVAEIKGAMKCPLPGCPMTLHADGKT